MVKLLVLPLGLLAGLALAYYLIGPVERRHKQRRRQAFERFMQISMN